MVIARYFILGIAIILWLATIAIADNVSSGTPSNNSVIYLISVLLAIIQTLIGYIYISGQKNTDKKIDGIVDWLKTMDEKKLDKELHKQICPEDKP